jgi:nicotinamide-nucleotide amidase
MTTEGTLEGVVIRQPDEPLRAAVLSVGSELLLGDLTDTNATWVSQRLRELGVEVLHHLAVRDVLDEFVAALTWLTDRVHLVIVGGGLGPTVDDLTREAIAVTAGVPLEEREDLAEQIERRFTSAGRSMAPQNLKQARIPRGATAYPPVGTAPGFGLTMPEPTATRVVALPGVPWELRELFTRHVAGEVRQLAGARATVTRVIHVIGVGESDVAAMVEPLFEGRDDVALSFLARSSEIEVRLTVTGEEPDAARSASQPLVDQVIATIGVAAVGVDDERLEDVVLERLRAAGQTIATAESATGGDIAARFARVPGASASVIGGLVVYTFPAKRELLGIPAELVEAHGEVSSQMTEALAAAARHRTGADWGIGVTGVAGPATVDELPVGTCFWALAHPDGHVEVHGRRIPGDRGQVIARLGSAAIDLLRRRLVEGHRGPDVDETSAIRPRGDAEVAGG